MRNPLCIVGAHKWRVETDWQQQSYTVCARPRCGRYRNDGSQTDFTNRHGAAPEWGSPMGGGGS